MRLGIALGAPDGPAGARDLAVLAQEAERLGFATAWTAEAYGCDAATTLGWIAAQASRVRRSPKAGTGARSIRPWLAPASTSRSCGWHCAASGSIIRARSSACRG